MKRVCLLTYDMSFTGGVEQVTASLSAKLCEDYEVYIYAIKRENAKLAYELDARIHYFETPRLGEGYTQLRLRQILMKSFSPVRKFLRETKVDTVLLMGNQPAFFALFARIFNKKVRYIYCDHGCMMNEWKDKTITTIRFLDALFSDKVVTLTQRSRMGYIQKFRIRESKVTCIYNWIDPKLAKDRKPYDTKTKKIISVGRFCEDKGYDLLVQVAKKVLPQNQQWEWHVYGEGHNFDEIKEMIQREGIENQLLLKGNVPNVAELYHQYAFLVLTSYREGLPLVLLEAKASGLPLVSFDILTGPSEIMSHEENGYLISPYDCDEMAKKMQTLMQDTSIREKFSKNADIGTEQFNQQYIIEQWKNLIDE